MWDGEWAARAYAWQDSVRLTASVEAFFPFRLRREVWDVAAYLLHPEEGCSACRWGYSGHQEALERGRRFLLRRRTEGRR